MCASAGTASAQGQAYERQERKQPPVPANWRLLLRPWRLGCLPLCRPFAQPLPPPLARLDARHLFPHTREGLPQTCPCPPAQASTASHTQGRACQCRRAARRTGVGQDTSQGRRQQARGGQRGREHLLEHGRHGGCALHCPLLVEALERSLRGRPLDHIRGSMGVLIQSLVPCSQARLFLSLTPCSRFPKPLCFSILARPFLEPLKTHEVVQQF